MEQSWTVLCLKERGHLLCSVEAKPENKPKVLQKHLLLEVFVCRNKMWIWKLEGHTNPWKKWALLFWQISMIYLMSLVLPCATYVLDRPFCCLAFNRDLKNPEFPTLQPAILAQHGPSMLVFLPPMRLCIASFPCVHQWRVSLKQGA